ncbi:MAG: hypothetical protein A2Z20_04430 [Bdellovibrionales bacterium RBG_16_40_8]|nr:MAG: hypothetical protein A2Z20_04430 [Bdellovibrionales bacterium RBG_16_40_8]
MILSEDRQTHFAHLIIDGIWKDDLVDYADEDMAIKTAKRAIVKFVQEFAEIDSKARSMVQTLKRNVPEGSPEWDVMFNKYFAEELRRRGG